MPTTRAELTRLRQRIPLGLGRGPQAAQAQVRPRHQVGRKRHQRHAGPSHGGCHRLDRGQGGEGGVSSGE